MLNFNLRKRHKLQTCASRGQAMKKGLLIIISIFFLVVVFNGCVTKKRTSKRIDFGIILRDGPFSEVFIKKYSLKENFTITRIEEKDEFYYIIVQSDSIRTIIHPFTNEEYTYNPYYQIVSLKSEKIEEYEEIKIGERYDLTLIPLIIHEPGGFFSSSFSIQTNIDGKDFSISVNGLNVYTTPNLDGLYYIKDNQRKHEDAYNSK